MKSYLVYFADRTAQLFVVESLQDLFPVLDGKDFARIEFFPYEIKDITKSE